MCTQEESPRIRIPLNDAWTFVRRCARRRQLAEGLGADAEAVHLPHCWNSRDGFQEGVRYYQGYGSYRRSVTLPEPLPGKDGRVWTLEAGGFYGTGDVWLDKRRIARVDGQYLGFSIDVTRHLSKADSHVLGIRLTNRCASHVLPGLKLPDFLLHGGLAGGLWLQGVPELRLLDGSVRIACSDALSPAARIGVEALVANASDRLRNCQVEWTILAPDGHAVAGTTTQAVPIPPGSEGVPHHAELTVSGHKLWSLDSPHLYSLRARVIENGLPGDAAICRFGIREAEFRPGKGFFLNGCRVELRGCNRHESLPGFGSALPAVLHREDARLIKELGLNFVRLSHYPQHPAFLEACDELGLLVCAELATWKSVRRGRWLRSACRQMTGLVSRDRNHPSVILWCMGNESRSRRAYLNLQSIARSLDPGRPVTYAENHIHRARRWRTLGIPDVWGVNYELDVLDEARAASARDAVLVTECSNYPHAARGRLEEELRQVEMIEADLARLAGKPFVAGFALWCFNDYATLRKERYRRFSGFVDAWRLPKMSASLLRARYARAPFVAVFADWSHEEQAATRDVHVFTNCPRVTIRHGTREEVHMPVENGRLRFAAAFTGLPLVARVERDGEVRECRLDPHGAPRQLALTPEWVREEPGHGLVGSVLLELLDAGGCRVHNWSGTARVTTTGRATVHPFAPDGQVWISGGIGRIHVSIRDAGPAELHAAAMDLESGLILTGAGDPCA